MKTISQTQTLTISSGNDLPAIVNSESIAKIRLDEARYPRYRNIQQLFRQEWLANQIITLAIITRIKDIDHREAIIMSAVLDEKICGNRYMGDLTLPEIANAFKDGVFGFYGGFHGLSAPNLYGFIYSYLTSELKLDATNTALKIQEKNKAYLERKKAENEQTQKAIRSEIEEAKRNGSFTPSYPRLLNVKSHLVDNVLDSSAHREKVKKQAEAIWKAERSGREISDIDIKW